MPRKRTRTRLRPAPFLAILLIANLTAGLCLSKLTVIRKVRVDGAASWDEARIAEVLGHLKGKPCALINRYEIESLVMRDPQVRTARLDRNLFGSAVLTIGYRNPVARFYNHMNMALSSEGVIYRAEHLPDNLPTVQLSDGQPKTILTLAQDWPCVPIAILAIKIREVDQKDPIRIDYGSGNSLCLNIGAGKVELGSCDNLDAKLQALRATLKDDPDYLSRIKSLNLVVPSNPMTVPK